MHWILFLVIGAGNVDQGIHNYDFDSKETCTVAGQEITKLFNDFDPDTKQIVTENAVYVCVQK